MNAVEFIRKKVFATTQAELGKFLGVTQPTVQRWEKSGFFPAEYQAILRKMGQQRRADWSDSWFFEVPASEPSQSPAFEPYGGSSR